MQHGHPLTSEATFSHWSVHTRLLLTPSPPLSLSLSLSSLRAKAVINLSQGLRVWRRCCTTRVFPSRRPYKGRPSSYGASRECKVLALFHNRIGGFLEINECKGGFGCGSRSLITESAKGSERGLRSLAGRGLAAPRQSRGGACRRPMVSAEVVRRRLCWAVCTLPRPRGSGFGRSRDPRSGSGLPPRQGEGGTRSPAKIF